MTAQTPTCVGYALYLELEKASAVTQVLVMPEGMSSSHNATRMAIYRRRLTPVTPRKTWKHAPSHYTYMDLRSSSPAIAHDTAANQLLAFALPYFTSLADNGWKLRNQAITVEVTAEDIEDSRMGRTPYKTLGRVWKTRKKLGFPKEFLPPAPEDSF